MPTIWANSLTLFWISAVAGSVGAVGAGAEATVVKDGSAETTGGEESGGMTGSTGVGVSVGISGTGGAVTSGPDTGAAVAVGERKGDTAGEAAAGCGELNTLPKGVAAGAGAAAGATGAGAATGAVGSTAGVTDRAGAAAGSTGVTAGCVVGSIDVTPVVCEVP